MQTIQLEEQEKEIIDSISKKNNKENIPSQDITLEATKESKDDMTSSIESISNSDRKPNEELVEFLDKEKNQSSVNVLNQSEQKSKKSLSNKNSKATSIPIPNIKSEPNPIPDLGSLELRKIKRVLLKNLLSDQIIKSKSIELVVDLPGDQIIVNGTVLDQKLFLKYQSLTHKAGYGPYRKIQINKKFIKVGDFSPDGFKGSGLGTFTENFIDQNKGGLFDNNPQKSEKLFKKEKQEADLKLEKKELNIFSENILDQFPEPKGLAKLFSVNLSGKKAKELFYDLHTLLKEDQLIDEQTGFALIELPKKMIRINGEIINNELQRKYSDLLSQYKIKRGNNRQIRLSKHIIHIGDKTKNGFKGTFANFNDDELFKNE